MIISPIIFIVLVTIAPRAMAAVDGRSRLEQLNEVAFSPIKRKDVGGGLDTIARAEVEVDYTKQNEVVHGETLVSDLPQSINLTEIKQSDINLSQDELDGNPIITACWIIGVTLIVGWIIKILIYWCLRNAKIADLVHKVPNVNDKLHFKSRVAYIAAIRDYLTNLYSHNTDVLRFCNSNLIPQATAAVMLQDLQNDIRVTHQGMYWFDLELTDQLFRNNDGAPQHRSRSETEDEWYARQSNVIQNVFNALVQNEDVRFGDLRPKGLCTRKIEDYTLLSMYRVPVSVDADGFLDVLRRLSPWAPFTEIDIYLPVGMIDACKGTFSYASFCDLNEQTIAAFIKNATQFNIEANQWALVHKVVPKVVMAECYGNDVKFDYYGRTFGWTIAKLQNRTKMLNMYHKYRNAVRTVFNTLDLQLLLFKNLFGFIGTLWKIALLAIIFCALVVFLPVVRHYVDGKMFTQAAIVNHRYVVENVDYGEDLCGVKTSDKPLKRHQVLRYPYQHTNMKSYGLTSVDWCFADLGMQYFDLKSANNKNAAIKTRVLLSNITENYAPDFPDMVKHARELGRYLREKIDYTLDPMIEQNMIDYIKTRSNYTIKQKEYIIKCWLETQGMTFRERLDDYRARFTAFLKDEPYFETNRPRNILAASEIAKVYFGCVFNKIAEPFFESHFCIKLKSIDDRPRWIEEQLGLGHYIYQTDHSAFESSATKEIQEHMEMIVYHECFPEFENFDWLLEDQIFSTGRGPMEGLYKVEASRWSGCPNTSLGNSITNYLFIKMIEEHCNTTFDFLIEGDDGLIASETELDVDEIKSFAEKNGFDLKMEQRGNLHEAGFLSLGWDGETHVTHSIDFARACMRASVVRPYAATKLGYWNLITAKMLSLAVSNKDNELAYFMYCGACKLIKKGQACEELNYWNLEKAKFLNMTYDIDFRKGKINFGHVAMSQIMRTEYFEKFNREHCLNLDWIRTMRKKLLSGNASEWADAVKHIITAFHILDYGYTNMCMPVDVWYARHVLQL